MVVKTGIFTNVILYFKCLLTKAVSLDIVPDASCQSFIRNLKIFISRHAILKLFISDNAKNFVGQELTDYTQSISTNWSYILEATPWWGGFWERMVQLNEFCERF